MERALVSDLVGRNVFAPSRPRKWRVSKRTADGHGSLALPQSNFVGFSFCPSPATRSRSTARSHRSDCKKAQTESSRSPSPSGRPALIQLPLPSRDSTPSPLLRKTPTRSGRATPHSVDFSLDTGLNYVYLRPKSQKFTRFLRRTREGVDSSGPQRVLQRQQEPVLRSTAHRQAIVKCNLLAGLESSYALTEDKAVGTDTVDAADRPRSGVRTAGRNREKQRSVDAGGVIDIRRIYV